MQIVLYDVYKVQGTVVLIFIGSDVAGNYWI